MKICFLNLLIVFLPVVVQAAEKGLPVFPEAEGFGAHTRAGRGGKVIRVTNLKSSGKGSLRWALKKEGPRVVLFEAGGTIKVNRNLIIDHPYITIAGQTAPPPGIVIRGAGIAIRTHDVLVQHLRIRVGDNPNGPGPDNRDAVYIEDVPDENDVYNVVVDHCSLSWATDENVSLWYEGVRDVTISNCIISECLLHSLHSKGKHSKGLIVGPGVRNVTITKNIFAHNHQRNPLLSEGTSVLFVNNLVYNYRVAFSFQSLTSVIPIQTSVIGNVFEAGPETGDIKPVYIKDIASGSSIYLDDNVWQHKDRLRAKIAAIKTSRQVIVETPPSSVKNLDIMPNAKVKDFVFVNAGAMPKHRDSVDKRIIKDIKNSTGRFVNSQYEVGGWDEDLKDTSRKISLPENPNADSDNNGYTNLEEWIHSLN